MVSGDVRKGQHCWDDGHWRSSCVNAADEKGQHCPGSGVSLVISNHKRANHSAQKPLGEETSHKLTMKPFLKTSATHSNIA